MTDDHGLPGDIVLYPAGGKSALSSRLVAAGEILAGFGKGCVQYSHGAIMAQEPGFQWEEVFPRAVHSKVDLSRPFEIWRVPGITVAQRAVILDWCKAHKGAWYDILGVLCGGLIHVPGTYYCTRWDCVAYRVAGIGIGDEIGSPDSIPDSYSIIKVCTWTPGRGYT